MNHGGGRARGDVPGSLAPLLGFALPPEPSACLTPKFPRLDLGSGPNPLDGYTGLDRLSGHPNVHPWDFSSWKRWPIASGSIEALHSSHLIEHLPPLNARGQDVLVRFFEEAWRVCHEGALFELHWPVPFHPVTGAPMPSAWWDPTHYRHIPHQQIPAYFSSEGRQALGVTSYRIECNWSLLMPIGWRNLNAEGSVLEYVATLRKEPL